ncbi:hypothetical protein Q0M94_20805 (plasmid) [Deinococcus radiomollis]|uniref:hypothetical protein n=1 Tax=Deinococcus radiomollis TaxID=468916 RepID=UPI003892AEDE
MPVTSDSRGPLDTLKQSVQSFFRPHSRAESDHFDLLAGGCSFDDQCGDLPDWAVAHASTGLTRELAQRFPLETLVLLRAGRADDQAITVHGWTLGESVSFIPSLRKSHELLEQRVLFWAVDKSHHEERDADRQARHANGTGGLPCVYSVVRHDDQMMHWSEGPLSAWTERPPETLTDAGRIVFEAQARPTQVSSHSTRNALVIEAPRTPYAPGPWLCIDASVGDPLSTAKKFLDDLRDKRARAVLPPVPTTLGDILSADSEVNLRRLADVCRNARDYAQVVFAYTGMTTIAERTGWFWQTVQREVPSYVPFILEDGILWQPTSVRDGPPRYLNHSGSMEDLSVCAVTAKKSYFLQEVSSPLYRVEARAWSIRASIGYDRRRSEQLDALTLRRMSTEEVAGAEH